MTTFDEQLAEAFGPDRVRREAPLAPFTTFKVGGPAEWLLDLRAADDVRRAVALSRAAGVRVTVLGGGSNVLIADRGIRGLVVRVHGGEVREVGPAVIRADAGVTINALVRWTINRGLASLEAWAGTPGTVGGAVYGNAHFRGRLIGELIEEVTLIGTDGEVTTVSGGSMEFGYDYSRLHRTREIVLSADVRVVPGGDPAQLRAVARESLAFRKRTQPLESASAGCIFQNPDARDRVPAGIPPSAGALVDRAGLKAAASNHARVSATHANFIVNEGGATAADIRTLIDRCKTDVHERFGVTLREEIVFLGFDDE